MDPEHVALARCVRFAGQIIARTAKGADGLTAFQCAFQRASHPRAMPAAWEGGGGRARLFGVYLADAAGQTEFRFKS